MRYDKKIYLWSFLLGLHLYLLTACQSREIEIVPAFYHWQTKLDLTKDEQTLLDSLQVKKLYVKFFDIDWNESQQVAQNMASLQWNSSDFQEFEIVPTVFITPHTLEKLNDAQLAGLATQISNKIKTLLQAHAIREIQLDCDWTASTKEKYFSLLRQMRLYFADAILSSTIRLHQIKFRAQTGVPPVDRGMLMFYNMGEITDWETENSILDVQIAKSYLTDLQDYPLPLDVALPIYRWAAIYRNARLFKLIHQLSADEVADSSKYVPLAPKRYTVKTSTILRGHFLEPDDQIKIEIIDYEQLEIATKLLRDHLPPANRAVVFYHLEEKTIQHFSATQLNTITNLFTK